MSEATLDLSCPAIAVATTQPYGRHSARRPVTGRRTPGPPGNPHPDAEHLSEFLGVRDRMLRIAQRVIGRESGADDVVQDAWLRWDRTDRSTVRSVPAFLCRTTTLLAINVTQTAHERHRGSAASWAWEPPDPGDDPATVVERAEEIRAAMLLLVERLTVRERCAYVLREAFAYPYREIGSLLGTTEVNARQLVRRARVRTRTDSGRRATPAEQLELLGAFKEVARTGNPAALADLARDPASTSEALEEALPA
ncbi:sigma factor-like helix-turn-helix DNA-binding protein [Actinoplanes sp. NPDC048791]|uniref:sigma factor-like helix-turn-helix DNA-binding protein n=1 Tax=Actinoplanes sp. NPDC048791 TaxID=3154623 RepID=UPI0033DB753C